MPKAIVLNIDDPIGGPALEAIRRICEPSSRSRPHITVRYPARENNGRGLALYRDAEIPVIQLEAAGAFWRATPTKLAGDPPSTVFIRCESEELEALNYKPDYPNSVFHVTLYDGAPGGFSHDLFEIVRAFEWRRDLWLNPGTRLQMVDVRTRFRQTRDRAETLQMSRDAAELVRDLLGLDPVASQIYKLSDADRLKYVERLCEYIHSNLKPRDAGDDGRPKPLRLVASPTENALWTDLDPEYSPLSINVLGTSHTRESIRDASLFLTPPEVAREMVVRALEFHGATRKVDFGDPALGNGIFFASTVQVASPGRLSSAIGIEVDDIRAEVASSRWSSRGLDVYVGGFLEYDLDPTRSLVVSNPPYRRFQALDVRETKHWRAAIERDLGIAVDGRADLYVYFLLHAHRWMAPGCVAVWLLPAEFMQTNYGSAIRRYLTSRVTPLQLHVYDQSASQFENARVSSVVVVLQNGCPLDSHGVIVSTGDSLLSPTEDRLVTVGDLHGLEKWSRHTLLSGRTEGRHRTSKLRLGDLFEVRRGIATGANGLFVIDDADLLQYEVLSQWVKPVIPRSRFLASNVVEADGNDNPMVRPRLWLIDTEESLANIASLSPVFAAYLRRIEREAGSRRLLRSRHPFYRQERRPPPPFFFSYMAPHGSTRLASRFFVNRSRAVVLNNYLALYPRRDVVAEVGKEREWEAMLHTLLKETEARELGQQSRTYVGGLEKVEPGELSRVVVASVPSELEEFYARRLRPT